MRATYVLLTLLVFASCKSETPVDKKVSVEDESKRNIGEIIHIQTLFDDAEFESPIHFELLKELGVCDTLQVESGEIPKCAACSPSNFKLHEYLYNSSIEDAFMLQVKALTVLKGQEVPLPMRHLIVFARENGELVKVNGFRGNLIAKRVSEDGADDLIIRFYVPEDGAFLNCLFIWDGARYKFKSVEAIDGAGGHGSVKASLKDSISNEVYQTLMQNAMLF